MSKKINCYPTTQQEFKKGMLEEIGSMLSDLAKINEPKVKDKEPLMSIEQTMAFLKCSKQALWNWNKNGILLSHKIGRRVYYKKSEILNQLVKQI